VTDSRPFFFGKLPGHDDFVRHNAAGPDLRLLDQWLQEGLFQASRYFSAEWESVYRGAVPYQFCFQAEAAERILVGIVWPSRDRSGRKFPFIVALRDDREGLVPAMVPYVPVIYSDFLRRSCDLVSAGMNGLPLDELASAVGGLSAPSADEMSAGYGHFQSYLDSTTSREFWGRLLGDFDDPGKYLLFKNFLIAFEPLLSERSARGSLGVRFPLRGGSPSYQDEACFWVVLGSQLLRNLRPSPNVLWGLPIGDERSYLYYYLSRPPARTVIPLLRPEAQSDAIYRLDEDNKESASRCAENLPPRYRTALESPLMSLRDLLGQIMK